MSHLTRDPSTSVPGASHSHLEGWRPALGGHDSLGAQPTAFVSLLRELAEFCAGLDQTVRPEWIVKRMQFFGYDVESKIPRDRPIRERVELLNQWFFEQKRFQALADNACVAERLTLHTVLAKRVGSPLAISLIYAMLAQQADLEIEFANVHPRGYLKFFEGGLWRYVDVARAGRIIDGDELIEFLQSRYRGRPLESEDWLEVVPRDRLSLDYLFSLKVAYRLRESAEPLLRIQNWILERQPQNLHALGERAMLRKKLGQNKNAFADLKRYFSFMDRDCAPPDLARAFDELKLLFCPRSAPLHSP